MPTVMDFDFAGESSTATRAHRQKLWDASVRQENIPAIELLSTLKDVFGQPLIDVNAVVGTESEIAKQITGKNLGPDAHLKGTTALTRAILTNSKLVFDALLLSPFIDPNRPDGVGRIPLDLAKRVSIRKGYGPYMIGRLGVHPRMIASDGSLSHEDSRDVVRTVASRLGLRNHADAHLDALLASATLALS